MENYIESVNSSISQKANELMNLVDMESANMKYNVTPVKKVSRSSTYRPWLVFGGSSAVIGLLGITFSDSAKAWQMLLTCAGVLSAGYGVLQKNQSSDSKSSHILNYNEVKNYYIGDFDAIIRKISLIWDGFISSQNTALVNEIKLKITDEKLRSDILFKTYYLESIKISLMNFISELDCINKDAHFLESCLSARDRFASSVKDAIQATVNSQIAQYQEIVEIIKRHGL